MTTVPAPLPSQPQSVLPPDAPGFNPWLLRLPILFMGGLVLLLIALIGLLLAFRSYHADRIFPGVYAGGVPLGGLSYEAARDALNESFYFGEEAVFTFRRGDQVWQLSAAELGVSLDADATLAAAQEIGRSGNPTTDALDQAEAWFNGASIAPVVVYDQAAALEQLNEIAAQLDRPMREPVLTLSGTQVDLVPGQPGQVLDVAATLEALERQLLQFHSGEITPVILEAAPRLLNADATAEQLRAALSSPLELTAVDGQGSPLGPWTISPEQIAELLSIALVTEADGSQRYEIDIDMSAFSASLEALAPGLIVPPRNGRFHFDEATGQLIVIEGAVSGRMLNVPETLRRLEETVFNYDGRQVPMVFDYTLPRYHNQITAAELGIREMVAEATTYFEGSTQNRRTNIAVSTSRFDGIIIGPGEEFSFNDFLGEISEANGFVEGNVIFGGRTTIGIGGGVCQVSTTIFRAAFNGGFALTERNSHGYRVGFYELRGQPPGLDAAIWQPERDFRFQNNTPYHLLIEASIYPNDNALQFRFYSTQTFRTEIDAPIVKNLVPAKETRYEVNRDLQPGQILQVDYSAEGADVTVYRTVYDMAGNVVMEDYVFTHYLPWGAIYQVAPGDSRLNNTDA